jgi:hypothetical protein
MLVNIGQWSFQVSNVFIPEYIANLKLPIDTFYRESRSGDNIAKRNITTGLFGLRYWKIITYYFR